MLVFSFARRLAVVLSLCGASALLPSTAEAAVFGFSCLTQSQASSCSTGEQQLVMGVSTLGVVSGTEFVAFDFVNTAQQASSITDIYLDDDLQNNVGLFPFAAFQAPGVSYDFSSANTALPLNRPAGASVGTNTSYGFGANTAGNRIANGINAGDEWVRLVFALGTGTLDSVIAALTNGTLRVALNVQGFTGGTGTAGFINRTAPTVPEPGSLLLLGSGLAAAATAARRRKARA